MFLKPTPETLSRLIFYTVFVFAIATIAVMWATILRLIDFAEGQILLTGILVIATIWYAGTVSYSILFREIDR